METKEAIDYHLQHLKQLVLEVTDSCNLNCRYCGLADLYEERTIRNGKKLSFKKARTIIDYLFSIRDIPSGVNYPLTISFYGGEPLLNVGLIKKVIDYLKDPRFPKVNFGMTTNAMLLDKHMDFLVEHKFQLVISLDGNEINHSYRVDHSGNNPYKRIYKNIKLLQKKYPGYFQKYVLFNAVLHNRNSVEETYTFIKGHFDKVPLIAPLNTVGIKEENVPEFKQMYQNVNESILNSGNCEKIEAEIFALAPRVLQLTQYIFRNSGNVFNDYNDLIFDTQSMGKKKTGTCTPFAKKMFVTANGNILQCERIPYHFILGQVNDDHVELDVDRIAQMQDETIAKLNKQCSVCFMKDECPQCIYNIGNILHGNPKCPNFCNQKQYEQLENMTTEYLRAHPFYYEKILKEITVKQ